MNATVERLESADQPKNDHRRHGWLFFITRGLLALCALLTTLPLAVLTSTKLASFYSDPLPVELSGRLLELVQKSVWEAEVEMSRLSSNSTITPIERSGHYIQFDRPDVVIQAVQHMVESLQGS